MTEKEIYAYLLGNVDTLGGLSAQADTVGVDAIKEGRRYKPMAECLNCRHEWEWELFAIDVSCPECGAAEDRMRFFEVLKE